MLTLDELRAERARRVHRGARERAAERMSTVTMRPIPSPAIAVKRARADRRSREHDPDEEEREHALDQDALPGGRCRAPSVGAPSDLSSVDGSSALTSSAAATAAAN